MLEDHGFTLVRQRGSHFVMQRRDEAGATTVPVPDHKELKSGVLGAIIRQTGLPRALFEV
jgi:predicted RNA binding protein YcfA (HicA-like mRNA interferase family)